MSGFQWRIQEFSEVGALTLSGGGRQHTILPNFPKNWNWKNLDPDGVSLAPPLDPSANGCSTYLGDTGRERLIWSHSSARFCFELSRNSN